MLGFQVEVEHSGPIFDGRAEHAALTLDNDIEEEVAGQASAEVHTFLHASIRHSTPYYETQVEVRRDPDSHVVTDRGVIYGPWLEDGGSRSRWFSGYHSFLRAYGATQAKVMILVEAVVKRKIREME
jgi:hypothetical protein